MIAPVRREVLELLGQLSDVAPEVPLGQLMANLATLARGLTLDAIREVEDGELVEAAREYLAGYRVSHATHTGAVGVLPGAEAGEGS